MSLQYVPRHLDALDVVAPDERDRVLAKSEPVRRRHDHVPQPQVHVGIRARQDPVVALPVLSLHELDLRSVIMLTICCSAHELLRMCNGNYNTSQKLRRTIFETIN